MLCYTVHSKITICTHIRTQFSTQTYLFLYSGQLDPSSQIGLSCFLSSQKRHGRGVVASQSVAACGFPRVCFSFYLSPLFLSLPFFWSLLFPAQLSLCFFCFSISFASNLFFFKTPPLSSSFCLSPSSQAQFWLRYSTVCQPIAAPHSLPSVMACCSMPLSMSAAEHGRLRLLHYIIMSACCCRV